MALQYAHGSASWLASATVGTDIAVTGLGFRPKALRFWMTGISSGVDAASQTLHIRQSVGLCVAAGASFVQRCMGNQEQDAAATQVCTTGYRSDCVAMTLTSTPGADGLLAMQSLDADGFTLDVTDQGVVDCTIFWEAWGGEDIVEAVIGEISEPAATGNVNYSCGFNPSVVLFHGVQGTAAANTVTRNDAMMMVGAAVGPASGQQWHGWWNSDDASATSDTDRYLRRAECLGACTVAGGNPSARASLTAWAADGFTLNWIARATTNRRYMYLALQGGAWAAGITTIAGNSGGATAVVITETQGGIAFTPKGISLAGVSLAESAAGTSSTEAKFSMGCGSSTSSRRSQGIWTENGNATASECNHVIEYDAVLAFPSNAGALAEAIDIDAVLGDGFRLIVDTAGGVASELIGYVACGDRQPPVALQNYLAVDGANVGERIR